MGKALGDHLIQLRKKLRLTQDEAAEKIEEYRKVNGFPDYFIISRSSLANYEKGIRNPNTEKLTLLAGFYNEDIFKLMTLSANDKIADGGSRITYSNLKDAFYGEGEDERSGTISATKMLMEYSKKIEEKERELQEITIPVITNNKKQINSLLPSDFVLSYSSRREFIMIDKFRQLTAENRAKIEERIDMLLEMQQDSSDNKK